MRGSALLALVVFAISFRPAAVNAADDPDDAEEPAEEKADDAPATEKPATDEDERAPDEEEPPKKRKTKKSKKKRKKAKAVEVDQPTEEVAAKDEAPQNRDQVPPRVTVTADLLGATPVDSSNTALFGLGGGVSVGAEAYVAPMLGIHVAATGLFLSKDSSSSSTSWIGGQLGPRLHVGEKLFGALTHHDAWIDADVSYGSSGGIRRPGFDAGIGVLWEVSPAIRIGPTLRYQFGSDPRSNNAQLVTIGVTAAFGGRTRTTILYVAPDTDEDGVVDADDACVSVPAGEHPSKTKPGCPDSDGDGVIDSEDQCTKEPAGDTPDPDPSMAGCPLRDQDGDGIADDRDACPDVVGVASETDQSRNGCPKLAKIVEGRIEILQQVFFETDSATIKDESVPVLQAIAEVVKTLDGKRVRIEGHTDDRGTDQYNLDLSKRRARAVAQWLITNGGIPTAQLETTGYGKSRPIVSGATADPSQNRRVELIILDK
ncbi:MAG TPA: OmpA family protein [Kofleriaceae bacterium]|jgi:outer membrane protein OmpA-like peptidoglycan-associated protein